MTKRPREEPDEGKLSSDDLLVIVKKIQSHVGTERDKQQLFEKEYPEFVTRYPYLFRMACEDKFDFERFQYMLNLRDRVEKSHITLDDASKEIGQRMFDVYVKDNVPPSNE